MSIWNCKNKFWCVCKIDWCLVIKRNEILIHATTWISIKVIVLSEIILRNGDMYWMSLLIKIPRKCRLICNDRKQVSVCLGMISSVQFSCSFVSESLRLNGLQHARLLCPSPTPGAHSNSCPLSQWCHPTISSSVIPFSSHLQSFPASGSFQMNQFFTSGGQSIGVSASASVLPMNTQDWFF